jgi:hypothetical protein
MRQALGHHASRIMPTFELIISVMHLFAVRMTHGCHWYKGGMH